MSNTLRAELQEAGYDHISIEALQAVLDNEIKLSHKAHTEFNEFMRQGAAMFAPA